jgi:hypothetical protein
MRRSSNASQHYQYCCPGQDNRQQAVRLGNTGSDYAQAGASAPQSRQGVQRRFVGTVRSKKEPEKRLWVLNQDSPGFRGPTKILTKIKYGITLK